MVHGREQTLLEDLEALLGHAAQRDETADGRGLGIDALLLGGRRVGHRIDALLGEHRDRAQFARVELGLALGEIEDADLDVAADQIGDNVAAALERHHGVGDAARGLGEVVDRDVIGAADEGRAPLEPALLRLRLLDQVVQRLDVAVGAHRDQLRVEGGAGETDDLVDRDRDLALRDLQQVRLGQRHDGVAVALHALEVLERRGAAAAGLVDHHHVLAELAPPAQHHHPGGDVGAAARTGVGDDVDGLARKLLLRAGGKRQAGRADAEHRHPGEHPPAIRSHPDSSLHFRLLCHWLLVSR